MKYCRALYAGVVESRFQREFLLIYYYAMTFYSTSLAFAMKFLLPVKIGASAVFGSARGLPLAFSLTLALFCAALSATAREEKTPPNSDKTTYNFTAIDLYAQRVPQHIANQSLAKLTAYLVKPAANDVEKARAIARWITSNIAFDFEAHSNERARPADNPDSVFLTRRALEGGFAALFVRMMHLAGVEAAMITGVKKGFNFTPGDASTLKRHVWNAFRTEGKWRLVDLPVYKEVETESSYKLAYADSFFCIPPEQMIYTHFPDDKRWQILDQTVGKEEFLSGVQCFGALHGYLITAVSHREYEITSKNRVLTLSFDAPASVKLGVRGYADKNAKEQGVHVKTTRNGRLFVAQVKFPADGAYKLEITATESIRERGSNEIVGYSIKTLAEYAVSIGNKQPRSMASAPVR